jgi:hypothetical protein
MGGSEVGEHGICMPAPTFGNDNASHQRCHQLTGDEFNARYKLASNVATQLHMKGGQTLRFAVRVALASIYTSRSTQTKAHSVPSPHHVGKPNCYDVIEAENPGCEDFWVDIFRDKEVWIVDVRWPEDEEEERREEEVCYYDKKEERWP